MKNKIIFEISKKIKSYQFLSQSDRVVVGVSGGSDSTALMHILAELDMGLELHIIYIDHGLRPDETPAEISFVEKQAKLINAQFYCAHVDVKNLSKAKKISTEEAARNLRYKEFRKLKEDVGAKYIAVGHNSDDQVEEFLIRLIRGSGRKGLSGMDLLNDDIARPLLSFSKLELRGYLAVKGIAYCEDSSNAEKIYLRNQIRLDLIPELKKYNPAIQKNIINSSKILKGEEDLLNSLTRNAIIQCVESNSNASGISERTIKLESFHNEHLAIQRRILETSCWKMGCKPSFKHIERLVEFANNGKNGSNLHLNKGLRISKHSTLLKFHYPHGKINTRANNTRAELHYIIPSAGKYFIKELNRTLTITESNTLPDETSSQPALVCEKINFPLCLRYHKDGEKIKPLGASGSKKVSRILSDKKIHGEGKSLYPVLCHKSGQEDEIIAIIGVIIADKVKLQATSNDERADKLNKFYTIDW